MERNEVNPACELCRGACCEGLRFPVTWFQSPDIETWFAYHGVKDSADHIYLSCPCCNLKDGRCSIYDSRPEVCRMFTVGSVACRAAIHRNRLQQEKDIVQLIEQ